MKKANKIVLISLLSCLALLILSQSYFIVYEDEIAIVKQFSETKKVIVNSSDLEVVENNLSHLQKMQIDTVKGLKFKIPFIQKEEKFTTKNLTYISNPEVINTNDDKKIEISMYAQYRIIDPYRYKIALGHVDEVRKLMDNQVYPVVVQSANNLTFNEFFYEDTLENMIKEKQNELNEQLTKEFGIYVTDIGIYRKNFPEANIEAIEQKMTMQIEKDTQKLQSEGDALYEEEKAKTDRQKVEIISEAKEKAAVIKAEADTQALKIYQDALVKDLEFYKFIQRMNIYKEIDDITIFLDKENSLLDYINGY